MFSTAGAGAVQLNDGCGLLVTADGIDGIESKDGSGFGVVIAVVGGCVVFASVIRGGDTRPGLDVVRGLSRRKPVPVFGGRNGGRGFAKFSEVQAVQGVAREEVSMMLVRWWHSPAPREVLSMVEELQGI